MPELPPPYGLIRDEIRQGQVIPFLGSGASLGGAPPGAPKADPDAHLPTATQLAELLVAKTDYTADEPQGPTKVAQYLEVVGGCAPLGSAETRGRSTSGHEFRLVKNTWVAVGIGSEFGAGTEKRLLSLGNLRWGTDRRPRVR